MPNRIIKESIKRSPEIDRLSWFEEVVFYRMIVTADDYGRIDGRMVVLKNDLFPTKDTITKKAIEDAVSKLVSVGLLVSYVDDESDMPYLAFTKWEKHQTIRNKYSRYPAPPDGLIADCKQLSADCRQMREKCRDESESKKNLNPNQNQNHDDDDTRARVNTVAVYAANNLQHMSAGNIDELAGFQEILPDDVIRFAIDKACGNGAPRWAYTASILQSYVRDGIKTVGDAKAAQEKHGQGKRSTAQKDNPALHYEQRTYDDHYGNDLFIDLDKYSDGSVRS